MFSFYAFYNHHYVLEFAGIMFKGLSTTNRPIGRSIWIHWTSHFYHIDRIEYSGSTTSSSTTSSIHIGVFHFLASSSTQTREWNKQTDDRMTKRFVEHNTVYLNWKFFIQRCVRKQWTRDQHRFSIDNEAKRKYFRLITWNEDEQMHQQFCNKKINK